MRAQANVEPSQSIERALRWFDVRSLRALARGQKLSKEMVVSLVDAMVMNVGNDGGIFGSDNFIKFRMLFGGKPICFEMLETFRSATAH